ncbi:MAG TPA: hypothetical protein VGN86_12840 [Pyrinomonadaceae bacterium]|nr:hypothetical protein [Pyrinomonadaceae bacterium]
MEVGSGAQPIQTNWWKAYGPILIVYVIVTWFTNAYTMGDTFDYANAILAHQHGSAASPVNPFWDFGHLFWRPLGLLCFRMLHPISTFFVGKEELAQVNWALLVLGWLGGLGAVLAMRALASLASDNTWLTTAIAAALLVSNAFLNYAQTGSAYVPGLALVLAASYLLAKHRSNPDQTIKNALPAAACLALAVCLWLPFVLAVPAALTLPLILHGINKSRLKLAIQTALFAGAFIAVSYLAVAASQGLLSVSQIAHWASSSAHGYHREGVLRTIFGIARSFISVGNDTILFKRYLLHDPYSPVSTTQLFRLGLWKLGLFYGFLILTLAGLLRSESGRRYFLLLVVNALPVLFFALFVFEGGMPERYLPLYPMLFLALAYLLGRKPSRLIQLAALAVLLSMCISNFSATARSKLAEKEATSAARIRELQSQLDPGSLVTVSHLQDDLVSFNLDYPFNAINRAGNLKVYSLVEVGARRLDTWREDFAKQTFAAWQSGGGVWVSRRLLSRAPQSDWNWVEGDDPRVSWNDLYSFFAPLQFERSVGGEDGFILLARNDQNWKTLSLARERGPLQSMP